ncbi:MAG: PA2779 family protein [Acidiferrobacterales bacterium]|nr:PA2779 family protein [Acidiferrobacterales bacterium]
MKTITRLTLFLFFVSSVGQPVMAAMIGTDSLLHSNTVIHDNTEQRALRQLVSQVLIDRGVSISDAERRAASLSHTELQTIQNEIDQLPAGQGVVEVLGIVFIVLLVLEILGVTNVFNRI